MLVSVIIINYNTFQLTADCIESVIRHTHNVSYEIIVVDNASPKDDPEQFLVKFPSIRLIKSKENGGFAKGNNRGIEVAAGDMILLLNSDTILTEDSISIAANALAKDNNIGALSVRLVYPDGKLQHTARKFRSVRNEILDLLRPLLMLMPYRKRAALMLNQYFHGDHSTYCDWVSGAFMMFRREVHDQLPGAKLDERFFMYGEDQLWCYQFHELGYRSFYDAETTVIHIHSGSTAPAKQMQLLGKLLESELTIMKYRKGASFYYFLFSLIFTVKEKCRYYIKSIVFSLFRHKVR